MIRDGQTTFSDAQAITSAAASTNVIDLSVARDMGIGQELYVVTVITTALTDSSSNSTVAVTAETDTADSFGSATTAQTLYTIAAVAAAGTVYVARLQPFATDERYLRLYYTPANGNLTTGAWDSFLVATAQLSTFYPKGYEITNPS